jgi:AhpD family alkylhydroperoxidase
MARIAILPEHRVSAETQAVYDRVQSKYGKMLEPIAVTANHPEIFKAYSSYERWFGTACRIDQKLKELSILKVASMIGCPFCIDIGSAEAREAGITEAQLHQLSNYRESGAFSDSEIVVLDYAVAMTRNPVEVDDPLFSRLQKMFDPTQIIEITAAIAWENYRSRFNHALGMQSHGLSEPAYCIIPEGVKRS